ncbi:MAG: hypothetical protein JXA28_00025 [Bacteroidetes bacterium]|nr:hypothetical protein [Bacteroidota bacterium]
MEQRRNVHTRRFLASLLTVCMAWIPAPQPSHAQTTAKRLLVVMAEFSDASAHA